MIRHRSSSAELLSSDYFFAVCPVSVRFQRGINTRINLYFQKSVQIISKHQCSQQHSQKDQTVQFPNPLQIKYFRIQSQKNMDYSWTLYVLQMDDEGESQQFIEAQKITLKQDWNTFKSTKKPIFEQILNFNIVPCKLTYIVIIGNNNQQVLDLAQKYFSEMRSNDQKKVQVDALEELKAQSNYFLEQLQTKQVKNIQIFQAQHAVQKIDENKQEHNQEVKTSELRPQPSILQPNISLNDIQAQSTENFLQLINNQNQKLEKPEIDINKQIKEQIVIKQTGPKEQQVFSNPQEIKPQKQLDQKNTSITHQETLAGQKQITKPIQKQTKFLIAFFILAILVFTGGYSIFRKNNPSVKQKSNEDKKSKHQNNKNKKVTKKK